MTFGVHSLAGRVPRIGGTHRDAWLDFEVKTAQGLARVSLTSEARPPLMRDLGAGAGVSEEAVERAVFGALKGYAIPIIRQRFSSGETAPM
jgi:hypothetical protein